MSISLCKYLWRDAIRHGNWLEARGLVNKLLSVGTVQDISSLEKLIKGAYS